MSEQQMVPGMGDEQPPVAGGNRRAVVIGGVAVVVAALAAGGFMLMSGSNDAATLASTLPTKAATTHSVQPSPSATSATPLPAATEPNRHDPFKPLFPPKPVPTPTPTVAPTVPGVSGSGLPTAPGGTGGGVIGPSGSPGSAQNVVKLVSITGSKIPTVTVTLDGVQFVGSPPTIFGGILQVMSIRPDDGAATFQLGDATFDLHIGQSYANN
jgi:hypothetical protein